MSPAKLISRFIVISDTLFLLAIIFGFITFDLGGILNQTQVPTKQDVILIIRR